MLTAVLFDLDGTLTDPAEGITRSIAYALDQLGRPARPYAELCSYIGPPLRQTFARLLDTEDATLVERAVALYRERFGTLGLLENQPYPGVAEMLAELRGLPLRLFLATSKAHIYARRILAHFALDQHFSGVYGSELDGRYEQKGELLAHLIASERLAPATAVMVGDRLHDVAAARQHGMRAIGVTYGYGSAEELRAAGADWLCATPHQVLEHLRHLRAEGAAGYRVSQKG